jgi:predicted NAD/FAD-dependent oxidoreductase
MKGKNIERIQARVSKSTIQSEFGAPHVRSRELACHRLDQSFRRQIWWSRWAEAIWQTRSRDIISPECLSEMGLQKVEGRIT